MVAEYAIVNPDWDAVNNVATARSQLPQMTKPALFTVMDSGARDRELWKQRVDKRTTRSGRSVELAAR
jgi:hypothetical protein